MRITKQITAGTKAVAVSDGLEKGRTEGHAEGRAEEIAEGRAEGIAVAVKAMYSNGLPF